MGRLQGGSAGADLPLPGPSQVSILLGTVAFLFVLEVLPGLCHGQSLWVAGVAYGVTYQSLWYQHESL